MSFNTIFFYEDCHSLKRMSPTWTHKLFVFIIILLFNDFMFALLFLYLVFFLCFSHDCNLLCFDISSCDHHLKFFIVLHVTFKYVFFTQLLCFGFHVLHWFLQLFVELLFWSIHDYVLHLCFAFLHSCCCTIYVICVTYKFSTFTSLKSLWIMRIGWSWLECLLFPLKDFVMIGIDYNHTHHFSF